MPDDTINFEDNIFQQTTSSGGKVGWLLLMLYTAVHRYSIYLLVEDGNTKLSCVAELRKPLAGENWTTGLPLTQGAFSIDTFSSIIKDIVGNELVALETESGKIERFEDRKPEEGKDANEDNDGKDGGGADEADFV